MEPVVFVPAFFPPHRVKLGDSAPKSSGNAGYLFLANFADPVVVSVYINDEGIVDFLFDMGDDILADFGFEGEPGFFFFQNFFDHVGDNLLAIVQIHQTCRRQPDIKARISVLELDLVVV